MHAVGTAPCELEWQVERASRGFSPEDDCASFRELPESLVVDAAGDACVRVSKGVRVLNNNIPQDEVFRMQVFPNPFSLAELGNVVCLWKMSNCGCIIQRVRVAHADRS